MPDKVSVKLPRLKEISDDQFIKSLGLDKICGQMTASSLTRIKAETTQGRTANGSALRAYSKSYADLKKSATGSDTVNLTVTQELLRSMQTQPIEEPGRVGSRIVFSGSHAPSKGLFKKDFSGSRPRRTKRGQQIIKAKKIKSAPVKLGVKSNSKGKKAKGQGSSLTNTQLAEYLFGMGFKGWFEFSRGDVVDATRKVTAAVQRGSKALLDNLTK